MNHVKRACQDLILAQFESQLLFARLCNVEIVPGNTGMCYYIYDLF